MTLHDWLTVALRNLAPAAQERMTAEYRAHVQDAMMGGLTEPEAVATLGDPAQVNRALRRTQLTVQDERWLRHLTSPGTRTRRESRRVLWLLPLCLPACAFIFQLIFGLYVSWSWLTATAVVGAVTLVLLADLRMGDTLQAGLRSSRRGMTLFAALLLALLVAPWPAPLSLPAQLSLLAGLALLALAAWRLSSLPRKLTDVPT
ncbi:HAAS signaling domain-containing protein [Deinococcus sp. ME38]|uniref:HAAS signaling domain-containing protein n=1 Tax=Deinococcus sp. ME38 TaxID=3400344 RepID=UPI003B593797